jgi:ketosteroid isomerase-like protein
MGRDDNVAAPNATDPAVSVDRLRPQDFERLAELYAEDVRWVAVEPKWSFESRDDVFEMFRARFDADVRIDFDEIRATPGHVILFGHVGKDGAFASLFTVDEGRITSVQDFEDVEALEATLV